VGLRKIMLISGSHVVAEINVGDPSEVQVHRLGTQRCLRAKKRWSRDRSAVKGRGELTQMAAVLT
jgi:hypothetical protein